MEEDILKTVEDMVKVDQIMKDGDLMIGEVIVRGVKLLEEDK